MMYWIIGGIALFMAVVGYGGLRYLGNIKPVKV